MSRPEKKTPVYVVAAIHEWNQEVFADELSRLPGDWRLIDSRDRMTVEVLDDLNPEYVFFLHWSWKVPSEITSNFQCVVFHMTDLPYGRGGSPLQNLIARGHTETMLSAIVMTDELDAGAVYLKRPLSLHGPAHEIFKRSASIASNMVEEIITSNPEPQEQTGQPVYFKRRTPAESAIPDSIDTSGLYDFIRMLDAEGYPRAFIETGGVRAEFYDADLSSSGVTARTFITAKGNEDDK